MSEDIIQLSPQQQFALADRIFKRPEKFEPILAHWAKMHDYCSPEAFLRAIKRADRFRKNQADKFPADKLKMHVPTHIKVRAHLFFELLKQFHKWEKTGEHNLEAREV